MVKPATTKSRKEQLREATEAHTPAVLAVACPYCGAQAGQLCTRGYRGGIPTVPHLFRRSEAGERFSSTADRSDGDR